jgi:DNA polymerase III subunit beta
MGNMKITIARNTLIPALARASQVADKKSTLPVLECALLQADATGLRVAASDMLTSVSQTVPCETKTAGGCAAPARELLSRIKAMVTGDIQLEINAKGALVISAKGSKRKFTLQALKAEDFPAIPEMPGTAEVLEHVETATLASLINKTLFSASLDSTRAHLNGALFEFTPGQLRLVTTDGHRLSLADAEVGAECKADFVVGVKALQTWRTALADKDAPETIAIAKQGPVAFLRVGDVDFSTKLPDQPFVTYGSVMPQPAAQQIAVDREALLSALRAVRLAADGKTSVVRLTVNGSIKVDAQSATNGDGVDEVAAQYDGPEVTAGFSAAYLCEALEAMTSDDINVSITGELDPALIVPIGDERARFIVMPTRPS